jgi:predicted aspartyl protease
MVAAVIAIVFSLTSRAVLAADGANEVPFKLYREYAIVVRGSIGNVKNLNFLLDTGAVPSVLDRRIAQKLHLTGSVERLSVFTQNLDTERVIAPDVQLGPQHVKALPVVVRDLSFAEKALGTRVDAMIGFDFLGQGPFTIDYQFKRIAFGPIDSSLVAIPYQAGPGYAVVEMKIQQQKLFLLVDTGASNLVLFAGATRDCPDAIQNVGAQPGLTWAEKSGSSKCNSGRPIWAPSRGDREMSSSWTIQVRVRLRGWMVCWEPFRSQLVA